MDVAVRFCRRVVALRDGVVVFDGPPCALTPATLHAVYGGELPPMLEPALPNVPADARIPEHA